MAHRNDRARKVLAHLGRTLTWDALHAHVREVLGHELTIKDLPAGSLGPGVTGAWFETDERSLIVLSVGSSEALRKHTLLHEYSHILLKHRGCDLQADHAFESVGRGWSVGRLLKRSGFPTPQEISAEKLACELARRLEWNQLRQMGSWT